MDDSYNYKEFAILYVDDEEKSLRYFKKVFEPQFRILVATNAEEGFQILDQNRDGIGILMTDERMPGEDGVQLLEKARELRPWIVRILVTAYSDFEAAIRAVNTGAIYRYVSKPWNIDDLETTLRRGLEFFIVQRQRDQLLKERLTLLREIMVSDRLISLGILSTGLSHHLRNSLVAIRTFIDLAQSKLQEEGLDLNQLKQPEFWKEFYGHAQKELHRITEMLTGLGTFSDRSSASCFEPVNVNTAIARALDKMRSKFEEKRILLDLQIPDPVPKLDADPQKLDHLIELLLIDELTHLPQGSRIRVRVGSAIDPENGMAEVILKFEDDGPGLPEDMLRSIFDPFFLRSDVPQEYGMNLIICYFLVYHHGGRIDVKNSKPHGTEFTITLPAKPKPPAPPFEAGNFLHRLEKNEFLWNKLISGKPITSL